LRGYCCAAPWAGDEQGLNLISSGSSPAKS
jgi:hypothetical protein